MKRLFAVLGILAVVAAVVAEFWPLIVAVAPIAAVVVAVLVPLITAVVVFGFPWLAEESILFTKVNEGTAKAIMRGSSFDRFIMSFKGYHLNPTKKGEKGFKSDSPSWEVLYHGKDNANGFEETEDSYYDDRSWLLKKLGLYWVGWPWANSVYVYQFEWNETYTESEEGKEKVLPRAEVTDFIYVADFTYAIVTDGAETNDRLPTDELTLVTVAIRNPYRALFSGEDWIRRITAAINRQVRNFVGSKGYDDLISIKKDGDMKSISSQWSEEFSKPIIDLSDLLADEKDDAPLPRGLRGRYGVEIRTADLQTVELSGDAKTEAQKAAAAVYTAEQEARSTLKTGQAKADVIGMIGEKEAEALRVRLDVIKDHGAEGMLLAQLDAMRESSKGAGNTVIWANNPFVPLAGKGGEK